MDFLKILKRENTSFAKECLSSFNNQNVIIFAKTSLPKKKAFEIYYDRCQIQKIVNKTIVFGYEDLLEKLKKDNIAEMVKIISFYAKENMYIIFVDGDDTVISILKSLNGNVGKIRELIKTYPIYYNDDYLFFAKGKQISKELFLASPLL